MTTKEPGDDRETKWPDDGRVLELTEFIQSARSMFCAFSAWVLRNLTYRFQDRLPFSERHRLYAIFKR